MNNYYDEIKNNTEFQVSDTVSIQYKKHGQGYDKLIEKYQLSSFSGEKDLDKALNLLAWVNTHVKHKGNYDNSDRQDALTLLKISYDTECGVNCLSMSIILCECLLALQINARVVYMMPESVCDGDSHVVVEAFISELNKWIMLDPTYGSYCLDSEKTILNLLEIRNCIAENRDFYFSETMNYNGAKVDDMDDVKNYYTKNLFFLRCKRIQGFGQHTEYGNILEIAPKGFDVHEHMIENLLYRIDASGCLEIHAAWMEYEKQLENTYIDAYSIYETPILCADSRSKDK